MNLSQSSFTILPKIADSSLGGNTADYQSKAVGGRRHRRSRRLSKGGRRHRRKHTQKRKHKKN